MLSTNCCDWNYLKYFHFYYWVSYNTRGAPKHGTPGSMSPLLATKKLAFYDSGFLLKGSSSKKEFESVIFERFLLETWTFCCTQLSYLLSCLHESEFQQRTWLDHQSIISLNERMGINYPYSFDASLMILVKRIKTLISLVCWLSISWTEVYEVYSREVTS